MNNDIFINFSYKTFNLISMPMVSDFIFSPRPMTQKASYKNDKVLILYE